MFLALLAAAVVFAAQILSHRMIQGARRGQAPAFPWVRTLLFSLAIGGLLLAISLLLEGPEASWVAAFVMTFTVVARTRDVIVWRRFFGRLDFVCTDTDPTTAEAFLRLRQRPNGYRAHRLWSTRILLAAHRAHALGRSDRALAWLDAFDLRRLAYDHALLFQQYRAAFAIGIGQLEIARIAVRHVPSPLASPEYEEAFAVLRTLLAVLDGDASETRLLEVHTRRAGAMTPAAADGWDTIEAHLLAARGDVSGARSILQNLRDRSGDVVVARIARHGGPASPVAARLADEGPYR